MLAQIFSHSEPLDRRQEKREQMKTILNSRQMLAACVLARVGGFTLAGQQLSLTQSAVSCAIKALEEEVECKLFTRTGRGATVTRAGKHFVEHAEKILALMETAVALMVPHINAQGEERLRLGVGLSARKFVLPTMLPIFQQEYPNKLVTTESGNYLQSLELLEAGLLDFVFSVKPVGRPEFGYVHLFEEELRFIVGAGHPWAQTGTSSREDLNGNALLLSLKTNYTSQLLANYFRSEGITPAHIVQLSDVRSIKELVKSNLAVAVLSPSVVARELSNRSFVSIPLGSRALLREWGLAYLSSHQLSTMDQRFIELCQLAVPGILSRMQDQPVNSTRRQKISRENGLKLRYGSFALFLFSICCFLGNSPFCETSGAVLRALL